MRTQPKIQSALYEPLKHFAIRFKVFCEDYYLEHSVPYPSDEELWDLFMKKLAEEEKLHTA